MDLNLWLAFAAASAAMGLIPGPGVTAIVGHALGAGRKTALAAVAGMTVGNAICMTLSLAGVGAVLAASAVAFSVMKWAGALYLIGLGCWTLWRARRQGGAQLEAPPPTTPSAAFFGTAAVGTFHPKTIVFFVAFAPQFMDARAPYWPQAAILVVTFCGVVASTDALYAVAASLIGRRLRQPRTKLWSQRASGGALIAAGVATAAAAK